MPSTQYSRPAGEMWFGLEVKRSSRPREMAKGENFQEKVLNFGVLNRKYIGKWKYEKNHTPPRGNADDSFSSSSSSYKAGSSYTLSSAVQWEGLDHLKKQPSSHGCRLYSSREEVFSQDAKESRGKVTQQDFVIGPRSSLNWQQNALRTGKFSDKDYSEMKLDRGKRKGAEQKITPEMGTSLSGLRKHRFSHAYKDKTTAQKSLVTNRVEELQHNLSQNHCLAEHKNIVLLLPKQSPQKNCPEIIQPSEPRALFDGKRREADWESFSDAFSYEEVHSQELYSEIPHSCPLYVGEEIDFETSNTQPGANAIWTSNQLDQEATEPTAVKERHPSPIRRFSFSRGRMGRSSSFKEGSIVPQLSSTYVAVKSGPATSKVSDSLDNAGRNRATTSGRARSSPLRRLLAPLLKIRAKNPHHSAETIQPVTGNLNLTSEVIRSKYLQGKKHEASMVQALLHLIVNNGLPLFKLVNNNNDILIAMTKLPTSVKDDAGCIYKFYSVRENKKSGSWINQKHKDKSYKFGYNIVGRMKVSSLLYPDSTLQSSEDQLTVRESVLYGVDLRWADQETQELTASRELAAIVVKIPFVNSCYNGEYINKGKEGSQEDRNSFINAETEKFNSTTVIIPGGVHGLPNKGFPSPLIDRWRSGGLCDCGGWDVGCKLRILTNEDQKCKLPGQYISCSNPDHFDLFDQGGGAQDFQPIFSLIPLKNGNYSVEFSASISLLQAFSVCVAAISSQNSFDFPEANSLSEPEVIQESTTPTIVQGEVPTRYAPSPPPSPVGRA